MSYDSFTMVTVYPYLIDYLGDGWIVGLTDSGAGVRRIKPAEEIKAGVVSPP